MSLIATAQEIADLKRASFAKLDSASKPNPMMQVSASQLISVCIAFEQAATGNYETLEYNNELMRKEINAMRDAFTEITKLQSYGSDVYQIAEKFSW